MRCLITGVAGFVGTNLALYLLKKGHQVIGTDSLSRKGSELNLKYLKEQFPEFSFIHVEIEDLPSVIHIVKPELVYHFAAQVAVTSSLQNPRRDFSINAIGTFDVALAAKNIGTPVVYTSTNKVFGDNVNSVPLVELKTRYDFEGKLKEKGIAEDFPIDAKHHTPYGCSKLVGDIYVREFGGVVNRCSCMYGQNQHGIMDQGWISYFAINKIQGNPAIIYGDGKQVRDAVHGSDVVRLLEMQGKRLLDKSQQSIAGEVFNVGGGFENSISLLELCKKWDIKPEFGPWRPADQKVFYCDISKAERLLGWKPEIKLDQGLDDIYSWTEKKLSV
ncbi:nucleoside-diphosphate sugar epimerase [Candidatus Pacearchaeota archaeon CG10_big_fil_rev_8_21_14_0_10_31_24]|nr:MAG: nucleoside-diphosphate sugar epimerase [Candidatus Pacearchaeota archaeon CG10_big_fil_rev_8_21_14_0_10_31_24]